MTTSRPWLGISTPPWLIKSDTPQSPAQVARHLCPPATSAATGKTGPARHKTKPQS